MKISVRRPLLGTALLLCFLTALPASLSPPVITLHTLDNEEVHLFSTADVIEVLVFIRTDCPISNRYAPELQRLAHRYTAPGVRFWLVYVDPNQAEAEIRAHRAEFGYSIPGLLDPAHKLVRLSGAQVTPEAAVFKGRRLLYRGRIDDRYQAFGKSRPAPSQRDLEQVLSVLARGGTPPVRTTRAIGCYIADLQ